MNRPRYPIPLILTVARTAHTHGSTHADRLAVFGLSGDWFAQFHTDIETAAAAPSAGSNRIQLRAKTLEKDDVLEACASWGGDLKLRLDFAYGTGSPESALFPSREFAAAQASEAAMAAVMRTLLPLAEAHAGALTAFGQSPAVLEDGRTLLASLQEADEGQESAKDAAKASTQQRWILLNRLIEKTNQVNRAGRRVFRDEPDKAILFASRWPRAAESSTPEFEEESPVPEETSPGA